MMKRKTCFGVLALCALTFSACSTTPVMTNTQLKDGLINSDVVILPIDKPISLVERTKAQAIGNMVVSSVAGSAAASAGGAGNMQQLQSNVQIGQQFGQQLNQALPNKHAVSAGRGVEAALAKRLTDFFDTLHPGGAPKAHTYYMAIHPRLWELGYVSLLTSHQYALNYLIDVSILEKHEEKYQPVRTFSCTGNAAEKMPLDDWKANNYEKVDTAAEAIVEKCFSQFVAAIKLK